MSLLTAAIQGFWTEIAQLLIISGKNLKINIMKRYKKLCIVIKAIKQTQMNCS